MHRSLCKTTGGLLKTLKNSKFYFSRHLSMGQSMGEQGQLPPVGLMPPPTSAKVDLFGKFNWLDDQSAVSQKFIKLMSINSGRSQEKGHNQGRQERTMVLGNTFRLLGGKYADVLAMSNSIEADDEQDIKSFALKWTSKGEGDAGLEEEAEHARVDFEGPMAAFDDGSSDDDGGDDDGDDDDFDDADRKQPRSESAPEQTNAQQKYEGVYWTGDGRRVDTRLTDDHLEGAYVRGDGKVVPQPYQPEADPSHNPTKSKH